MQIQYWRSYAAAVFLTLTIGLLWLFTAAGPTQQTADAGILANIHARREARQQARAERWERIRQWHEQHGHPQPRPQPQPQPQPKPQPQPTPPSPVPVPPTPNVTPAPPSPVVGTIAPANCWVIVVIPSLIGQGDALAAIERSTAIRQALNYQFAYCDPTTAPPTIVDAVARATKDAYPRTIVLDQSKGAARIVGSYPVVSEADLLATIKTILGTKGK